MTIYTTQLNGAIAHTLGMQGFGEDHKLSCEGCFGAREHKKSLQASIAWGQEEG